MQNNKRLKPFDSGRSNNKAALRSDVLCMCIPTWKSTKTPKVAGQKKKKANI